jgi:hypothetical protein
MNIYSLRPQVRAALWLWLLLTGYAQEGPAEWALVSHGNPLCDTELALHLRCPEDTVRRWRERLEGAGLIRCTLLEPRYRRIELRNLNATPESAYVKLKTGLVN